MEKIMFVEKICDQVSKYKNSICESYQIKKEGKQAPFFLLALEKTLFRKC
jgi:hypothetical protein